MYESVTRKALMIISLIVASVLVVMIVVGIIHGWGVVENNKELATHYSEAIRIYAEATEGKENIPPTQEDVEKAENALAIMNGIQGYKDSEEQITVIQTELNNMKLYLVADEMSRFDRNQAAQRFHALGKYRDSFEREEEIYKMDLEAAKDSQKCGKYSETITLAGGIPEYSKWHDDAEVEIRKAKAAIEEKNNSDRLAEAVAYYQAGELDKAQTILMELGSYPGAENCLNQIGKDWLAEAKRENNNGNHTSSWDYLIKIDEKREYPSGFEKTTELKASVIEAYQGDVKNTAENLKADKELGSVEEYLKTVDTRICSSGWISTLWKQLRRIEIAPLQSNPSKNKEVVYLDYKGNLTDKDQIDSYLFTAENSGASRIFVSGISSDAVVHLGVYDSLGYELNSVGWIDSAEGGVTVYLSSGENYEVRVGLYRGSTSYKLRVCCPKKELDITGITQLADSINFRDQVNTYHYTVPRDGRYRFDFSDMKADTTLHLNIKNEQGDILADERIESNGEGLTIRSMVQGQALTIEVCHKEGFTPYNMNIYEQKEYASVARGCIVSDSVEYIEQRNVYEFRALSSGEVTVTLSSMPNGSGVDLLAFNSTWDTIASDENARDGSITFSVTEGERYEIQVRQVTGFCSYTMSVD